MDMANVVMPVLQTCQDVPLQAVAMLETGAPARMFTNADVSTPPPVVLLPRCCALGLHN